MEVVIPNKGSRMKGFKLISPIGLLLASLHAFSLNPAPGWYTGLIGGVTYLPKVDFNVISPIDNTTNTGDLSYLIGGNGGLFLGYRFCHLRLELEPLFNDNRFQEIELGQFVLTGSPNNNAFNMTGYTYFVSGLINGIYE